MKSYARRRVVDTAAHTLCALATVAVLLPLVLVLYNVGVRGFDGLDWAFLTELPGAGLGGMANAILGSAVLVALACIVGIPTGVFSGVYLALHRSERAAQWVRFAADVMAGVPPITVGVFVYAAVVVSMDGFSALAGGIALGILMVPTIACTTDELVRTIPESYEETALGLGVPHWRVVVFVVLRAAAPGIATGVMLCIARIAGETAPLLFTAHNNSQWIESIHQPTASLPVMIYSCALSPQEAMHGQAWTAALVLVVLVLVLNVAARLLRLRHAKPQR